MMSHHFPRVVEDMGLHMDRHMIRLGRFTQSHNLITVHTAQSKGGAPQMDRTEHGKARKRLSHHGENLVHTKVCRRHVNALNVARLVLQPGRDMLHLCIGQILQNETDEGIVISAGDILERQGDVLHGSGVNQNDHLSLSNAEIVEQKIVL
jgi:hypothetical protein